MDCCCDNAAAATEWGSGFFCPRSGKTRMNEMKEKHQSQTKKYESGCFRAADESADGHAQLRIQLFEHK
jgi:hypothetical protein